MQPIESVVSGLVSNLGTIHEAGTGLTGAGTPRGVRALVAGDAPVRGDTATISAAAKAKAGAWGAALDSVQSLLGRIRVGEGGAGATRAEVKGILSSVRGASSGGPISNIPLAFTVSDIADGVERFRLVGADLQPGESAAVEVEVTQSAQTAALLLSFGGLGLDLSGAESDDPSSRFVIEVGGAGGQRELSFASGTTLAQIVDTINTFTEATGVAARVSGTGIRLSSTGYGADAFASVRVSEDGGAVGGGAYLYGATNNDVIDPSLGATSFAALAEPFRDFGQDVAATINGVDYTGDGLRLRSAQSNIDAIILLEQWRAQTLGSFTAATVTAPGASGAVGSAPSAGLDLSA